MDGWVIHWLGHIFRHLWGVQKSQAFQSWIKRKLVYFLQASQNSNRWHIEKPMALCRKSHVITPFSKRNQAEEHMAEVASGSSGEWALWYLELPEWARAALQSSKCLVRDIPDPKLGTLRAGPCGPEEPPVQQTFSGPHCDCDSSCRPPITLPKKYQPLPPEPESSRSPCSQRDTFPGVQRGPRWAMCCCWWWDTRGGGWAGEGQERTPSKSPLWSAPQRGGEGPIIPWGQKP